MVQGQGKPLRMPWPSVYRRFIPQASGALSSTLWPGSIYAALSGLSSMPGALVWKALAVTRCSFIRSTLAPVFSGDFPSRSSSGLSDFIPIPSLPSRVPLPGKNIHSWKKAVFGSWQQGSVVFAKTVQGGHKWQLATWCDDSRSHCRI